uniref:Uncharacterized protein n=1 Tax=Pristionchus pacificus TaxID=54126 RepID=A0A454XIQ5_PRIPA|eukprot:PDM63593.1 hypothetical protein PRIPAC_49566 [Pristionchus pacificus]
MEWGGILEAAVDGRLERGKSPLHQSEMERDRSRRLTETRMNGETTDNTRKLARNKDNVDCQETTITDVLACRRRVQHRTRNVH